MRINEGITVAHMNECNLYMHIYDLMMDHFMLPIIIHFHDPQPKPN